MNNSRFEDVRNKASGKCIPSMAEIPPPVEKAKPQLKEPVFMVSSTEFTEKCSCGMTWSSGVQIMKLGNNNYGMAELKHLCSCGEERIYKVEITRE